MKGVVTSILMMILCILPISESEAKHYYRPNNQNYFEPSQIIYWRSSTFYQYSNGIIYATYYNKQVIHDLLEMSIHNRIRNFYVLPTGYVGSVPRQWQQYMYRTFSRAGIQILVYQPRQIQHYQYRHSDRSYDSVRGYHFHFRF